MQTLATLGPETALALMTFLKESQIPCEAQTITEETGLEATEILVEDDCFEKACEAADRWQEAMVAASQERTQRRCPKCHSPNVEYVKDFDYENSITKIGAVFHCKDCGNVIAT